MTRLGIGKASAEAHRPRCESFTRLGLVRCLDRPFRREMILVTLPTCAGGRIPRNQVAASRHSAPFVKDSNLLNFSWVDA
jgi:hypothetical protein